MVLSMTGYGKAVCNYNDKNISIEIKSLNSKQIEINTRMPSIYKEKEIEIRNEITRQAERGKIDLFINIEQNGTVEQSARLNKGLIHEYFNQLKQIAGELDIKITEEAFLSTLRMPEVYKSEIQVVVEEEWKALLEGIQQALILFKGFREQEGKALEKDITARLEIIMDLSRKLAEYETERIQRIRERIQKNLTEFIPAANLDQNRYEQEIIFYLEKIDITEEKVRLSNHCNYFLETLKECNSGKKLGFIAQEIGREINTIGSKANDSDIQKIVVMMKDELEKIKEQLMNIL